YPWFASHALAQVIRLGQAVLSAARQSKPAAQSILVVTNANDQSVSNLVTEQVVSRWRNQGAKQLHAYEFAADLKLGHDFIEPDESEQQAKVIYPKLVELITT